jgi:hypothetical protein
MSGVGVGEADRLVASDGTGLDHQLREHPTKKCAERS